MITNKQNIAISVLTADCAPILICDQKAPMPFSASSILFLADFVLEGLLGGRLGAAGGPSSLGKLCLHLYFPLVCADFVADVSPCFKCLGVGVLL